MARKKKSSIRGAQKTKGRSRKAARIFYVGGYQA